MQKKMRGPFLVDIASGTLLLLEADGGNPTHTKGFIIGILNVKQI